MNGSLILYYSKYKHGFFNQDRLTIESLYDNNKWSAYRIVKEFPAKAWNERSVARILSKYKATGTTARKSGSGRPVTVATAENMEIVEELISSQESQPGTHKSPREIAKRLNVGRESVRTMVKKLGLKVSKRVHTPQINASCRQRRTERSELLANRFNTKRIVKRLVWQDEVYFTLQVKKNSQNDVVYHRGLKSEVDPERLSRKHNTFSKKLMVSAAITWHGVTRPFFIDEDGMKVTHAILLW